MQHALYEVWQSPTLAKQGVMILRTRPTDLETSPPLPDVSHLPTAKERGQAIAHARAGVEHPRQGPHAFVTMMVKPTDRQRDSYVRSTCKCRQDSRRMGYLYDALKKRKRPGRPVDINIPRSRRHSTIAAPYDPSME
ncbi:hypothetical protein GCM10025862_19250 [Arsenicicoccus piscis]|uniref:Uncharacterized protein n=1 Tax=Arsenicicoccus piscis TaxID=673954 RepID=A0ABQ6HQE6_9MICO|nr:hypothetical protein GCM10025862_19250 [Arsenicicoccus piscis]